MPRAPLIALALAGLASAPAWAARPMARVYARAFAPGEALAIVVTGNDPKRPPSGTFGGGRLFFYEPTPGTFLALAGIDLEASTGTRVVELTLRAPNGPAVPWQEAVRVRVKSFATRSLLVAAQYVEPGPQQEARAEQETKKLKKLFAAVSPEPAIEGRFRMPIKGAKTTSRFGERSVFNGKARSPHSGADIKASTGTPVLAPQSGTVVLAEDLYFPGKTLMLDHGLGVYSLFAHLSEVVAPAGRSVRAGDVVARAGATGRVTGPHLHWAVKVGGARVDPTSMMYLPLQKWLHPGRHGPESPLGKPRPRQKRTRR